MDLQISTPSGDGQDLASLYRWLSKDAAFGRHARMTIDSRPADPGSETGMGAFEVINALLSDAGAVAGLGSFLYAFKTWRATRPKPPVVTIRHNGITVTVSEGSEQEIQPLLDALLRSRPQQDEEDTGGR